MQENFKNLNSKEAIELLPNLSDSDLKLIIDGDYKKAVIASAKREVKKREEIKRVKALYDFQETIAAKPGCTILGLDEVGRGPLAGPLTVGGVVIKEIVLGLNDSKKLSAKKREEVAKDIKEKAITYKTFSIPPSYIDQLGMTECLKRAFANVVKQIEEEVKVDIILLDGNPLYFDSREVNVIKGDSKCASISAASIVAKVERDTYMESISDKYPEYNFVSNKGYGTSEHIDAIKKYGLSPIHRKSFCTSFMQETLF
ncbi:MAG: ribonuclease HII [Coriobacteriia bacterium]|nr:ribonuclease HII [Coriobacteriia bacterium]